MDVRYAAEVFDDLKPSVIWFNSRREGLGQELEDEFYAAVAVVRGRPYSYFLLCRPYWVASVSLAAFHCGSVLQD